MPVRSQTGRRRRIHHARL